MASMHHVVLVAGYFNAPWLHFKVLQRTIERHFLERGLGVTILAPQLPTVLGNVRAQAVELRGLLHELDVPGEQLILVAHSTGCLVARQALRLRPLEGVHAYYLAGPFCGTPLGHAVAGPLREDLRPRQAPSDGRAPLPSVWEKQFVAEHDLIVPRHSASALHVSTELVEGVDHGGLVWRPSALGAITRTLSDRSSAI